MAPQGKKRIGGSDDDTTQGVLSRLTSTVSDSPFVSDIAYVTNKLLRSTGKAAWIAGTTFLVLFVPLIIAMDREQQLNEMEAQQTTLLGAPPS